VLRFHLALNNGPKTVLQEVQRLTDAFVVGDGHPKLLDEVLDLDVAPVFLQIIGNEPPVALGGLVFAA